MTAVAEFRRLVPTEIVVPAEYTDAVLTVYLDITDDGQVTCPGLPEIQAVLARGSVDMVKQTCGLWTRWLARAERQHAERQTAEASS